MAIHLVDSFYLFHYEDEAELFAFDPSFLAADFDIGGYYDAAVR